MGGYVYTDICIGKKPFISFRHAHHLFDDKHSSQPFFLLNKQLVIIVSFAITE